MIGEQSGSVPKEATDNVKAEESETAPQEQVANGLALGTLLLRVKWKLKEMREHSREPAPLLIFASQVTRDLFIGLGYSEMLLAEAST